MGRPVLMQLSHIDGCYTISQHPSNENTGENVLLDLGNVLEKFLTVTPQEFQHLTSQNPTAEQAALRKEVSEQAQVYNFLKVGNCLFRSQLDCYDPATDRVFDIKTRATAGIRYNLGSYREHLNNNKSMITRLRGAWSSYEREYYDLVRSKFLPFSFQLAIGQMHGAFMAYHNTQEMFGFQYITLEEINHRVYGSTELANWSFDVTCKLLEKVVDAIDRRYRNHQGALSLLTTIGNDDLDFYIAPMEADPEEPVLHLRLNLRREIKGVTVEAGQPLNVQSPEDVQVWSAITESDVSHAQFKKYLEAAQFPDDSVSKTVPSFMQETIKV